MRDTPERAYDISEVLTRLFENASPLIRRAAGHLTLRAYLHPALRPFREDPLQTLQGRYISLDALFGGICTQLDAADLLSDTASLLSPEDRLEITELFPGLDSALPVSVPARFRSSAVGSLYGAVFVPAKEAAFPVVVCAVRDLENKPAWPDPISVRPVSSAVESAALSALAAAVTTLERFLPLPASLRPTTLYYDVCTPFLDDAALQNVAGDSLGLPLTLAFLSALWDNPLAPLAGATGAVGVAKTKPFLADAISNVGYVPEKQAALQAFGISDFLSPETVSHVAEAIQLALTEPVHAPLNFSPPALSPSPHDRDTFSLISVSPPLQSRWNAEMRVLTKSVLKAYHAAEFTPAAPLTNSETVPLCAAFPVSETAQQAALALRQAFLLHYWEGQKQRRVPPAPRIALHRGTVSFESGKAYGDDIERLLLLSEATTDGLILASSAFVENLPPDQEPPEALESLRLRTLTPPFPLFRLPFPGEESVRESPRTLRPEYHNLPVFSQPRVGRDKEISEVIGLLQEATTRLVTLHGEAGLGKTRLALETAVRIALDYPDGVWLVSLGHIRSEKELALAIAEAMRLDVKFAPDFSPDAVLESLSARKALLILDNAEAALSGKAFVSRLLAAAPQMTVLAVALSRLRLTEETLYPVPPLPITPSDASTSTTNTTWTDAERLFVRRAQQVDPALVFTDSLDSAASTRDTVRRICRLLGGAPLSLEIVAAQVHRLSLEEIEGRLAEAFAKPSNGSSLLRTLEWAYTLLSAEEQDLFLRLAFFVNGFTEEAAEAIDDGFSALRTLIALEDSGFVERQPNGDKMRCHLLPPVQEFARAQMRQWTPEQRERVQQTHARYFQGLAEQLYPHFNMLDSSAEIAAQDILEHETENLRAALEYFHTKERKAIPAFVVHLSEYWRHRGYEYDLRRWVRAALSIHDTGQITDHFLRARLYRLRGMEYIESQDYENAERYIKESVRSAELTGRRGIIADMLINLGLYHAAQKEWDEGLAAYEKARALFREIGTQRGEITVLNNIGTLYLQQKEYAKASAIFSELIELCRLTQDRNGLGMALSNIGYSIAIQGKVAEAIPYYEEATDIAFEMKQIRNIALSLLNLGDLLDDNGDTEAAVPLLLHAEQLFLRIGNALHEEAAKYLARMTAKYGAKRLENLRREVAAKSTEMLLRHDPRPPKSLRLTELRLEH